MENRRKGIPLKRALRLKTVRHMAILTVFSVVVLGVCTFLFFFWGPIARGILATASSYAETSVRMFTNAVRSLFAIFFVLIVVFLWLTLSIARRMIGPFVRLNRVLEEMASGNIPEDLHFRQNDEIPFHELSEPFNRTLANMRKNREELEALRKKQG